MRILLAPMEGVVDYTMRDMLSSLGGLDRCVTEFVRVNTHLLPAKVFYRLCPELHHGGKTLSGTPVYVQLLGSNPELMAINALRAAELGALGIDINFGCPAKTVNKSDGGSILLREPHRLHDIVSAMRKAVPPATPVTAKIRLGYEDHSLLSEIVAAITSAGADELTIHARTKVDGYKPPAYWQHIHNIQANSPIPVIANGEVWTVDDYHQCRTESGCQDVMLGRGLLTQPDLAAQIKQQQSGATPEPMSWQSVLQLLSRFAKTTEQNFEDKYVGNRVKQWLGYLRHGQYPESVRLFEQIKRLKTAAEIQTIINQSIH